MGALHGVKDKDVPIALDRAYENGEQIETHLDNLAESLSAAAGTRFASTVSSEGSIPQFPGLGHWTQGYSLETYRTGHFVPPLPDNIYLDFDSQAENGKFRASEGDLKSTILLATSSTRTAGARSSKRSAIVHGESGMAGASKTTALIALGHDDDVRSHFCDVVLFIALGADVSRKQISDNLAEIKGSAAAVQIETNQEKAVAGASRRFQGKCNLFLIDDVWPHSISDHGYLPQLRKILTGNTHSRIVISTRNRDIVSMVGSHVDFDARDPLGPLSESMLIGYVSNGGIVDGGEKNQDLASVRGILRLCAVLPIALDIAGGFVAAEISHGLDFKYVCDNYLKDLGQQANFGATILDRAIKLSLDYLDSILKGKSNISCTYSKYEMYTSLCVLEKQQYIPQSALGRMWGTDDNELTLILRLFMTMSLGGTSIQRSGAFGHVDGISLHDLHLDFCCAQAQGEYDGKQWHFRLLKGHFPALTAPENEVADIDTDLEQILQHSTQKW